MNRILIVDDEPIIRDFFRDVAEECDFEVAEAGDIESFSALYETFDPTAILLDLTMPGSDGIEVLRELAASGCRAAIILASGQDKRILATAQRLGQSLGLDMHPPLQKPIPVPALEEALAAVRSTGTPAITQGKGEAGPAKPSVTERRLAQAIKTGELVLHYQPKIALQDKDGYTITGCEALVRWQHPDRGLVPPGEFVPLAERSSLIGLLTEVVLQKAVAQLRAWKAMGIHLPVSVNLSPVQLTDLSLPDRIAGLLDEAGVERELLVVEITEQAAMADIAAATDILTRLRLKNIAVSLDDFGAGYSSLVEIYRLPLSELKLDRSLIVDLDHDQDARTVVSALVALALTLGIPVCAEGIETQDTADFLQSIKCQKAQGFFFSKPLPAEDFTRLALPADVPTIDNCRAAAS